ncbi:Virulence factor MviN [gamma proteobacterium HdN1]|nr:Virulence factor MviN [gamma proteobacterium HdN1]
MSLLKSASVVSLFTLLSRITGLARELLIAYTFGASASTDAFNVAFRIPNLLRRLFAEGAFSQAFVPILAETRTQKGEEATRALINAVGTILALALSAVCILGVIGAPALVWLMASGLQESGGFDEAALMTRIMFPYIGFMSLVALSAGILNTWSRFAVPAATPVLLNVAIISAALMSAPISERYGINPIYALAVGVSIGGMLQLAFQVPALMRIHMTPRIGLTPTAWRTAWQDSGVRRILKLMAPAVLGVSVAQLSLLINTQIASHIGAGAVSWLTYADRLMEFPTALLGVALGVVLLPQLARAQAGADPQQFSKLLDWGLRLVLLLALPSAIALLLFSKPLVSVLYHYGKFSSLDVEKTVSALACYGVGLMGLIGVKVLAPGFYATQDIRTPVKIGIAVLIITQMLNVLFVPYFQHAGLALSIALGSLVNAGWLLIGLKRSGRYQPSAGWGLFALRILIASSLLGGGLWWASAHFDWVAMAQTPLLRIALMAACLLCAAIVYFGALRATGMNLKQTIKG